MDEDERYGFFRHSEHLRPRGRINFPPLKIGNGQAVTKTVDGMTYIQIASLIFLTAESVTKLVISSGVPKYAADFLTFEGQIYIKEDALYAGLKSGEITQKTKLEKIVGVEFKQVQTEGKAL